MHTGHGGSFMFRAAENQALGGERDATLVEQDSSGNGLVETGN